MEGRILVVDDKMNWQEVLKEMLTDEGYQVGLARSLEQAREQIERCFYHVALVDLRLGDDETNRDGIKILKYIESLDEGTEQLVISGYADASNYDEFHSLGISGVTVKALENAITKGQSHHDILKKVQNAMAISIRNSTRGKWSSSPFTILNDKRAYEVQRIFGVAPMTELRPFLGELVRPFYPWLQPKKNIKALHEIKNDQGKVLAIESLCWSRVVAEAVLVRFGRRDQFEEALKISPPGASFSDGKIEDQLAYNKGERWPHFEGVIYHMSNVNFYDYFEGPPVKKHLRKFIY